MQHPPRFIAHLDLDCFYVSVERIKDPSLLGKPVVVGGTPLGRGVVASASYEARAFGVRSAMPTGQALRLCPHLIVVRGHHNEYSRVSNRLYKRMLELAPAVERASIDEMYLDFTGCQALYGNDLPGFMKTLQRLVRDEFSLPCTIALASNKTVAKIAAGTVKPAGVISVRHGSEKEFLAPLSVDAIPGVGKKTSEILKRKGFRLIADIQAVPKEHIAAILGVNGAWIHDVAQGLGSQEVAPDHSRKSISSEETFSHDLRDGGKLEKILFSLTENVCSTLRSHGWKAKTITLKLRYADFKTVTRAESLPPTNDDVMVFNTVVRLFRKAYTRSLAVRLLGVRLSNFVDELQQELNLYPGSRKRDQILAAVDALREKYGDDVIHLGGV